ncbi:MAG TPA: polyprenyl synthetase family protein, partial [Emticicia sp.]
EKRNIINLIKNHSENPKKVDEVITFVKSSGGIDYTTEVMKRYVDEAKEILFTFPDSIFRQSLHDLIQFTIERTK